MKRFIASQLRKPHGWFGSLVVGRVLNRVNRKIVDTTLLLLEVAPQHDVLEIGFGGGSALAVLARKASSGAVTGVDFSPDMVQQAERRFRREIAEGRVRVQLGDVSQLPFPTASFDRVFTINTIYFWRDPLEGMAEIRRVLSDGGLVAVSLRSKEKMQSYSVTQYDFRLFSPEQVVDLMRQAGFREVRVDHRDREQIYDQVVVVGMR